jgi:hypothetical protein
VSSAVPESVRKGGRPAGFAQFGGLLFGVTMLVTAGALLYFANEPAEGVRLFGTEAETIALGMAVLATAIIWVQFAPALRMFGPKVSAETGRPTFDGTRELFEPNAGERQSEIGLIDAVRRAYKETRTSAGAAFATAFGNGPDDIVTMYATFFAEHVPIYGCKRESSSVEQLSLTAPPKEFQIEDGVLILKERQRPAIYGDRIKPSDYPIVLEHLHSAS